jgi:hypothetical protein
MRREAGEREERREDQRAGHELSPRRDESVATDLDGEVPAGVEDSGREGQQRRRDQRATSQRAIAAG